MSREKIESVVGKAGRALTEIVPAVERHGHDITPEQLDKMTRFLEMTLDAVKQRAQIARTTAIAASGAFSFDMELPEQPPKKAYRFAVNDQEQSAFRQRAVEKKAETEDEPTARPAWTPPEGRLVGSKEPYYPQIPAPVPKTVSELEVESGEVPDPKTGYIEAGFIDD